MICKRTSAFVTNRFDNVKRKLASNIKVFVIIFGPTVNSMCHSYKINSQSPNELLLQVKGSTSNKVLILKKLVNSIPVKIHAVDIYMHGAFKTNFGTL